MNWGRPYKEKTYNNPPVIEALCEFQFESNSWDLAVPGLIYERVKDTFPKRRSAKVVSVSLSPQKEGIEQQVQTEERVRFLREDENALIQVGRWFLAINHLKPYSSWREFLGLIEQGLTAYREIAAPKRIRRVGLRYINRIEIREKSIELEDYFHFRPFIGPELPHNIDAFISGIQVPFEGSRDTLKLQLTSTTAKDPNAIATILDLDYFLVKAGAVAPDNVLEWVDAAHERVVECFEASIAERLKERFEEVKE